MIDRRSFIASAVASVAVAATTTPTAALASGVLPAATAVAPALHLYEIGGWAWVFARSEEAARQAFMASRDVDDADEVPVITKIGDDDEFTMMFAEGCMPDGLTCDVECTCERDYQARFKEWGCECAAGDSPVTLPVREWAALTSVPSFMDEGVVFKEYEP